MHYIIAYTFSHNFNPVSKMIIYLLNLTLHVPAGRLFKVTASDTLILQPTNLHKKM